MTDDNDSDARFVLALLKGFDEVEYELDELDEEMRRRGLKPNDVGARMAAAAAAAMKRSPLNWRNKGAVLAAKQEGIARERGLLEGVPLDEVRRQLRLEFPSAQFAVQFRNFEEQDAEDMRTLLAQLRAEAAGEEE